MNTLHQPYRDYRPTAAPAYPRVPVHWRVLPLKRWVRINQTTLGDTTDPEYRFAYVDIGSVGTGHLTREPESVTFAEAPSRARRVIRSGDTIISTVRTYLKAVYSFRGDVEDVVASTGFAVLTPRQDTEPTFLGYAVQAAPFVEQVVRHSDGVAYPAINETRLGSLPVLVPSSTEQAAITRYCAHLDAKVARLVRAKRRLIALLNEQKQAVVQRTVLSGMEMEAPVKQSGVKWIGEIPAHWAVQRARWIFREVDIRSTTGDETHLSMSQKLGLVPRDLVEERRLVSESYVGGKTVRINELVLNRLKAHLGVFALANQPGVVSPDYTVLRPVADISPRYYELLLRTPASRIELRRRTKGIVEGFWRLYTDDFYDIPLPVPPLEEQQAMVTNIGRQTADLDAAIDRASREIELVREYRTRLVADVVTGQFDVRAATAALPDLPLDDQSGLPADEDPDEADDALDDDLVQEEAADAAD